MKTIVITGAASGIGKATAELFSQNGWNVAATFRDLKKASQFEGFKTINCYSMDVTNIESVDKCINQIIQEFGRIDVLLNNAGVYDTNPLESTSPETIDLLIKTNVLGVINVTKAVLPYFRKNKCGMIVNVTSIAGRATFPFQSVYHLTKWAIEGFSEGLRYELKNINIKVKSFSPGSVKTNLWKDQEKQSSDNYPKEYQDNFRNWFKYLNKNIQKGFPPEHEAKAIFNAVTDNKNRFRYSSDFNTKMAVFLHTFLPTNTFQRLFYK